MELDAFNTSFRYITSFPDVWASLIYKVKLSRRPEEPQLRVVISIEKWAKSSALVAGSYINTVVLYTS